MIVALRDDLARVAEITGSDLPIRLVENPQQLPALGKGTLIFYVDHELMIVGPNVRDILEVLSARQQPSAFVKTALYQRVAGAYRNGVGWLLVADLQQMFSKNGTEPLSSGVGDIQQLILEQRTGSTGSAYQAVIGFNQQRTGMATWLAPPGAIGATEFLSPNTYGAAAIVTKDPALIIDDFFGILQKNNDAWPRVQDFQREHRIDVRYDLAENLGNEFLIAIDGPILPTPAWKAVIEVNDAARLQNTIVRMTEEFNREASIHSQPGLKLTTESVEGRTFYSITAGELPLQIHYTFWSGYMIIAPARTLLMEAMRYHDSGNSLARSETFRSQFPADGRDHSSGFVYQNLQAIAGSIPIEKIQETVKGALPTLISLYAETDRITMSSKGVLGANVASLAGFAGMIEAIGVK